MDMDLDTRLRLRYCARAGCPNRQSGREGTTLCEEHYRAYIRARGALAIPRETAEAFKAELKALCERYRVRLWSYEDIEIHRAQEGEDLSVDFDYQEAE